MEQRELEGIEQRILSAEEELHTWQKQMEDPKVLADRNRLHEVCTKVDAGQKTVQDLYARWQDLEARKR